MKLEDNIGCSGSSCSVLPQRLHNTVITKTSHHHWRIREEPLIFIQMTKDNRGTPGPHRTGCVKELLQSQVSFTQRPHNSNLRIHAGSAGFSSSISTVGVEIFLYWLEFAFFSRSPNIKSIQTDPFILFLWFFIAPLLITYFITLYANGYICFYHNGRGDNVFMLCSCGRLVSLLMLGCLMVYF